MTINEKAKLVDLTVEKVVEIASTAGIDTKDLDRKLETNEATKLGMAVKKHMEPTSAAPKSAPKKVRFWCNAVRRLIQAGDQRIELKGHVLVLDPENDEDAKTIKLIRGLRNIVGRYSVHEVIDKGHDEDSTEIAQFSDMLEEIVFTGHTRERSKAGMKAVRALFSPEELEKMGESGFDPRRLVMKALNNKSLKLVSNN